MTFVCDLKQAALVEEVLRGTGTAIEIEADRGKPHIRSKSRVHYVNGMRNKGISGNDAVLERIKASPATREELRDNLVQHGFAGSSLNPLISRLLREKKVMRQRDGKYVLFA